MTRIIKIVVLAALALGVFAACGGDDDASTNAQETQAPSTGKLRVVTTVSPITSIVENIGGDRIELEGIVPEGVNSHTFEPAPSVADALSTADLIVINGLFLEQPTLELAEETKAAGTPILMLGDEAVSEEDWKFDFSFPESDGNPNPHAWPDPLLSLEYARLVHNELARLDPENATYYAANLAAFEERINDLDGRIRAVIETIPPANRKLLTYHDSWAYFAERYGMTVVGAVQPSDFSEPSAREVAGLIDQIRDEGVPAVFGSEVFPSDVLETIAEEGGAEYIDELRDDDLPGEPGDADHSYFGLMMRNIEIMAGGLGGDASAMDGFDTGNVFEGESGAVYPQ